MKFKTKRKVIPYNPALKEKARHLRDNSSKTEVILWQFLKSKQLLGYDFHRQKPLDEFIVDFFCSELLLAIEIDDGSHIGNEDYDNFRQQKLERFGVRFLRFKDDDVFYNCDWVVKEIEKWISLNNPK